MTPRDIDWPATLLGVLIVLGLAAFWFGVAWMAPEVVRWFA